MTYSETLPSVPGATWRAPDAWASENETGDLLYGLTCILKPLVAIETGCYKGDSSLHIGAGMNANGMGRLLTCDTNPERVAEAKVTCADYPVDVLSCTGEELCRNTPNVDLAFLDSSGDRVAEAKALAPNLTERAIVVLHDARRDTYKRILQELGWQSVFVDSPRGLAILQP